MVVLSWASSSSLGPPFYFIFFVVFFVKSSFGRRRKAASSFGGAKQKRGVVCVCVSRARAFDTVTLTQGKEREGKKWVKKQRDFFFFENFVSIIKP